MWHHLKTALLALMCFSTSMATSAESPAPAAPRGVLFEDVRVFDGTAGQLSEPVQVLVVGNRSYRQRVGAAVIADSPDAVRTRAREQLALGASQIKLMAGGGVASSDDSLDVTRYTVPELRAAVEAAENWGTYVAVHAYTPRAVRQAIEAGVASIEHGQLLDEETVRLIAEHDLWWSLQPFIDDQKPLTP